MTQTHAVIESVHRIEIGNFVRFLEHAHGCSYASAEALLPDYYFEPGALIDDEHTEAWCAPFVAHMKERGLETVYIYQ